MSTVKNISDLLKMQGISPAKMSRDLDFSSGSFTQWKDGRSKMSLDAISKMSEYLQVSTDYIIKGPSKHMVELLAFLGDAYIVRRVDREDCLYRKINNRYDLEISGCYESKRHKTVYVWDIQAGVGIAAQMVDSIYNITTKEKLKETLDKVVEKYSGENPINATSNPQYNNGDMNSSNVAQGNTSSVIIQHNGEPLERTLSGQEAEMLRLFSELSFVEQSKVAVYAAELKDKRGGV